MTPCVTFSCSPSSCSAVGSPALSRSLFARMIPGKVSSLRLLPVFEFRGHRRPPFRWIPHAVRQRRVLVLSVICFFVPARACDAVDVPRRRSAGRCASVHENLAPAQWLLGRALARVPIRWPRVKCFAPRGPTPAVGARGRRRRLVGCLSTADAVVNLAGEGIADSV